MESKREARNERKEKREKRKEKREKKQEVRKDNLFIITIQTSKIQNK